ncbi:glutamate receptor ionotropic, kainate 2-like isoform X2 [Ornithodoros turicata]
MVFRQAIDAVNSDPRLGRHRLAGIVQKIKRHDAFHAGKAVCKLLKLGVMGVLGPASESASGVVRAACSRSHIPHIFAHSDDEGSTGDASVTINLATPLSLLGRALRDLVLEKRWKSFTVIYEGNSALMWLRDLLTLGGQEGLGFGLRQSDKGRDLRKLFREVGRRGETNVVLHVPARRIAEYLREAHLAGMLSEYHNYILTSLDMHVLDLREFQRIPCNLTSFHVLQTSALPWFSRDDHVGEDLASLAKQYGLARHTKKYVKLDAALVHDAVFAFSHGLQALSRYHSLAPPHRASCDSDEVWTKGLSLVTQIKAGSFSGLSGTVQFDSFGRRSNVSLDIVELKPDGLKTVGRWDLTKGINYTRTYSMLYDEVRSSLRNKTFRVTSLVNAPYMMLKNSTENLEHNDRFEGFCVDLLHEIARLLHFDFKISLVRDSAYGSRSRHGEWNGMIREVLDREADMAIGDLSITYARESAVDFTTPFLHTGIGILYRRPEQERRMFSFLLPMTAEVWLGLVAAYLGTSAVLHLVARLCPGEWIRQRRLCKCASGGDSDDRARNPFSVYNSFWYTISALMFQDCGINPRASSTRLVVVVWWFFSFILVSFYTANMAAFLVNEKLKLPIENVHDLARQSEILYCCLASGSTEAFFRESRLEPYQKMWATMASSQEDLLVRTNAEGVERVLSGGYAFFMESMTIEYLVERDCRLTQIGGLLDSKGYGIAMPTGSPYTAHMSWAILKLQESGTLQRLKWRWWSGHCTEGRSKEDSDATQDVNSLGIENVGGVFLVLLGGLGVSSAIAILEFIWNASRRQKNPASGTLSRAESKASSGTQSGVLENAISVLPAASLAALKIDVAEGLQLSSPRHGVS